VVWFGAAAGGLRTALGRNRGHPTEAAVWFCPAPGCGTPAALKKEMYPMHPLSLFGVLGVVVLALAVPILIIVIAEEVTREDPKPEAGPEQATA
jgi:hypothetical protein